MSEENEKTAEEKSFELPAAEKAPDWAGSYLDTIRKAKGSGADGSS